MQFDSFYGIIVSFLSVFGILVFSCQRFSTSHCPSMFLPGAFWGLMGLPLLLQTIIGSDITELLLEGHELSFSDYPMTGLRSASSRVPSSDCLVAPEESDSRSSSSSRRRSSMDNTAASSHLPEESITRFRHLLLHGRKKVSSTSWSGNWSSNRYRRVPLGVSVVFTVFRYVMLPILF